MIEHRSRISSLQQHTHQSAREGLVRTTTYIDSVESIARIQTGIRGERRCDVGNGDLYRETVRISGQSRTYRSRVVDFIVEEYEFIIVCMCEELTSNGLLITIDDAGISPTEWNHTHTWRMMTDDVDFLLMIFSVLQPLNELNNEKFKGRSTSEIWTITHCNCPRGSVELMNSQ